MLIIVSKEAILTWRWAGARGLCLPRCVSGALQIAFESLSESGRTCPPS